jgi:hypothetical protein
VTLIIQWCCQYQEYIAVDIVICGTDIFKETGVHKGLIPYPPIPRQIPHVLTWRRGSMYKLGRFGLSSCKTTRPRIRQSLQSINISIDSTLSAQLEAVHQWRTSKDYIFLCVFHSQFLPSHLSYVCVSASYSDFPNSDHCSDCGMFHMIFRHILTTPDTTLWGLNRASTYAFLIISLCIYVCMYVSTYVRTYVCVYLLMYVCMYV